MKKIGKQATATTIIMGMSNCSADSATPTPPGTTAAVSPSTQRMLKILLPTTFDAMDHSATRTLAVMILGFVLPLTIVTLVIGVLRAVWRKPTASP